MYNPIDLKKGRLKALLGGRPFDNKDIVSSEVEIVDYNSRSRSEGKIRRVFDTRIQDPIV